jgi:hypothetical protein
VLLECLEITLVFALTCSAVLLFLRTFDQDPTAPEPDAEKHKVIVREIEGTLEVSDRARGRPTPGRS